MDWNKMTIQRPFGKSLHMGQKLFILAAPSPTLPYAYRQANANVRGGSYCINSVQISLGYNLWKSIVTAVVLPSPSEGEGVGVRSAMQVNSIGKA